MRRTCRHAYISAFSELHFNHLTFLSLSSSPSLLSHSLLLPPLLTLFLSPLLSHSLSLLSPTPSPSPLLLSLPSPSLFIPPRYLQEYCPLGTAGGIYHFRDQILRGNPRAFFVLNSDVCCNFPVTKMSEFHARVAERAGCIILGTEVCVCVCACVRACVRACMHVCAWGVEGGGWDIFYVAT